MKYCADYIVGRNHIVAPLAGAWIEIFLLHSKQPFLLVAPLAGAWIEIRMEQWCHGIRRVAPLAGAWIEIDKFGIGKLHLESLPSRERGLKYCKNGEMR